MEVNCQVLIVGFASLGILIWRTFKSQSTQKKDADSIHRAYPPIKPDPAYEQADSGKEKDKSESSGLVIPFSLSEFSLITDKLTYKVGDTIRATVKVLSRSLGTTTVRLVSPSGQQLAMKTTGSHLSETFTFDLGVVEQSWEKGVWRVIARRGETSTEQKIEIL